MTFLIISHTEHYRANDQLYAYAPYVREMNLWLKFVEEVHIIAPVSVDFDQNINVAYKHPKISIKDVPAFSLIGFKEKLSTLKSLPKILNIMYCAMQQADHIHLRCPGNMGLLGCIVQIFFPKTCKTAKYAGNWDPKSKQPWSYKLQKWILSNTWLTKNMKVLVYGEWPNQTKNIKPFFTATYREEEKKAYKIRNYTQALHFCFVGSLSKGKQPEKAIELVEKLRKEGKDVVLHIYGEGPQRNTIEGQIKNNRLEDSVFLYGNQPKARVKEALQHCHFLILPSKSEGWPKVVAEAMFWGCIPIITPISCIPWILDDGNRGILMKDKDIDETVESLQTLLETPQQLETMAAHAAEWSRHYTLDKFEEEIRKLIND
jgi:glycosyltransferase involved in cell wall biosynthesis